MKLKVIVLFVTLVFLKCFVLGEGDNNYFFNSTGNHATENHRVNEHLSRPEFYLEIRFALNALTESITELQKTKRQYIDEVGAVLEKKLQLYGGEIQDLKNKLTEMKEEMQTLQSQLTETKKEIIFENGKFSSNIEKNMQNQIATMKQEIKEDLKEKSTMVEELETIRNQLKQTEINITTEIKDCKNLPQDCREVQKRGKAISGIYHIHPQFAADEFLAWCDMTTRGGGWTYILNRFDGSQNFYLNWTDYKEGFGQLSGEHWLGLEHVHQLTYNKPHELLVELVDWDLKKYYALYSHFKLGDESQAYVVESLGNYSGDAGDSFKVRGEKFSTSDRNHDSEQSNRTSCADYFESAWWFRSCHHSLLTGRYRHKPKPSENFYQKSSIQWNTITGYNSTLKEATMMIRPSDI